MKKKIINKFSIMKPPTIKTIFILAIAYGIFTISSCGSKSETKAEDGEHGEEHHDEHENANTATLTDEQMKSIKIELPNKGSIFGVLKMLRKYILSQIGYIF